MSMGRFGLAIFALALLSSTPFAIVLWSQSATDAINGKPAFAAGKSIFASQDGRAYAFSSDNGVLSWTYDLKEKIAFDAQGLNGTRVAVAGVGGTLSVLNAADGSLASQVDLGAPPLAFAADEGRVFAAVNNSLNAYSTQGKLLWSFNQTGIGQLGVGKGKVYFTSDGRLYALAAESGVAKWSADASEVFLARPVEYSGVVYLGGTDGRLYAFDSESGTQRWDYKTGGWIMTSPAADDSGVYFASNDGYAYGVKPGGQLTFKAKAKPSWSQPVIYEGKSGKIVAFADSEGKVYGMDAATGNELWSFSAYGKPEDLAIYGGAIVFGTSKGKAYSLSPSAICSFTYPNTLEAIGGWPVEVEGTASADSGIDRVEVRSSTSTQTGQWIAATGKESWYATVDFSAFAAGPITLECRVRDLGSRVDTQEFSYLLLIKADNVPLQQIYADSPYEVIPQEEFNLSARDGRGADIRNLRITIEGVERKGDSPFAIKIAKAGPTEIKLDKPGFEPLSLTVVGKDGTDYTMFILIFILFAVAAYFLVGRRLFGKKK